MEIPIIGWTIFGIIALIIISFSAGFVFYYKHRDEPAGMTVTVGFLALFFTLLSLFLIPVDVYMVSEQYDSNYRNDVKYAYYAFYIVFMFFLFFALPFAYFYYEELGDVDDRTNRTSQRMCTAFKYTLGFTIVWVVLMIIGLFVDMSPNTTNSDSEWTKQVTDKFKDNASRIIPFCMAVLTSIGLFFSMVYTSWGLASFPISIMKQQPEPETDNNTTNSVANKTAMENEIQRLEKELDYLNAKYRGRSTEWDKRDLNKKEQLESKRRTLQLKYKNLANAYGNPNSNQNISSNSDKKNVFLAVNDKIETKCQKCFRFFWNLSAPIRYLIGIVLILFSLLIVVNIIIHLIDQAVNSTCGYSCGFALNNNGYVNPIGYVLVKSSKYFPIDYILFSVIIFWLFLCTVAGINMIDVRILCFKLFSLRAHETLHNGLLMSIGFLLLIVTSFNYLMMNLAPDYTMYGHQNSDCNINDNNCLVTQIYYLLDGIMIGMPIFGLIYFVGCWLFVIIFFISVLYNIYREPSTANKRSVNLGYNRLRNGSDELEAVFRD